MYVTRADTASLSQRATGLRMLPSVMGGAGRERYLAFFPAKYRFIRRSFVIF